MTAVEGGDFEEGVRHVNRILAVRGQVLPASATPLTLHAALGDGSVVDGQSHDHAHARHRPRLADAGGRSAFGRCAGGHRRGGPDRPRPREPVHEPPPEPAHPGHPRRDPAASAPTVFVCNVATQEGETAGFDLAAHVEALIAHTAPGLVDVVVANSRLDARTPASWTAESVRLRWPPTVDPVPELVLREVVDPDNAHHHDPERLADAIIGVLDLPPVVARHAVGRTA